MLGISFGSFVLGKGFELSIKLRDDIGEVELVEKVEWWDVFFIMFGCIVDGQGRGRLLGDTGAVGPQDE